MATSTDLLRELESSYKPQLEKLREATGDTSLVDRAEATSDARFDRGVQAAQHMQAATGGLTTREAALSRYNATKSGAANRDASLNTARWKQDALQDQATNQLAQVERGLAKQKIGQVQHKEDLEQERRMHNDTIKAQNRSSKRGFWGNVAGAGLGMAAAAFL